MTFRGEFRRFAYNDAKDMKRTLYVVAALLSLSCAASAQAPAKAPARPAAQSAGTESGFAVFQQRCMGCHCNPNVPRAPLPAAIREMPPEKIYEALTTGVMKGQGDSLTEDQRRMVALFMSGRPLGSLQAGDAKQMAGQCSSNPHLSDPSFGPAWNGWGVDISNSR